MSAHFDGGGFIAALDATRDARRLSWRKVADQAGVSASTLTRMQQGKRPDANSIAALASWSGLDVSCFYRSSMAAPTAVPLAQVTAFLRADPNLSKEGALALEKIIQVAYEQFRTK